MSLELERHPHRRYNPLNDTWILVSPQRLRRPWRGAREAPPPAERPAYDPDCPLCPGNERAGGRRTPAYTGTYVFENDFPALLPEVPPGEVEVGGLLRARAERGICRVLCYSPRHDRELADLPLEAVEGVVGMWVEQTRELAALPWIRHVQIFENRGAMMGASSPHPHGQLWATETLPQEPARELAACRRFHAEGDACLLCRYLELELGLEERLLWADETFVVVVPFWALWPYETLVLPRRHVGSLPELTGEERRGLARALQALIRAYDRVFDAPFPYSMGIHQTPFDGRAYPELHLHLHFYPPLLRSATVRKFMVGYELLAEPQRDLTPEAAAARLREVWP